MPRKLTTEEFIERAVKVHGDKYSYGLVEYMGANTKIKIICPIHGVFEQRPNRHNSGSNCPQCSRILCNKRQTKTTDEFIQDVWCVHGDVYNYKLVDYRNNSTNIKIICPVHGVFEQSPLRHLRGSGCPKCDGKNKSTKEFIEEMVGIHGDTYSYEFVEYRGSKKNIEIVCPVHGTFEQIAGNHRRGYGCHQCSIESSNKKKTITTEEFIERAVKMHGDKYSYELVEYTGINNKIKIICSVHGVFEQNPNSHFRGCGCPQCSIDNQVMGIDKFIECAVKVHGDKYSYELVDYISAKEKVNIICPDHGVFSQRPDDHIYSRHGCPECIISISKDELELQEWLSQYIDIKTNDRIIINPLELDILIPSKMIAIEYNGLYWHSEQRGKDRRYHLNKYNMCKDKGYRLIQVWENEWLFKKDIIKSVILNSIGINDIRIHGRKCGIIDVSIKDARIFYDNNHIQGFKGGEHHGLYYNDELVSLMTIDSRGELQRFVNKINTLVHGAFSKLLKSFDCGDIFTFADLRYFTGGVYENNGFRYTHTVKPNYYYFKKLNVHHRRMFQLSRISKKYNNGDLLYFDPNKTEYQNMVDNGYDRIWDCGNLKFVYK